MIDINVTLHDPRDVVADRQKLALTLDLILAQLRALTQQGVFLMTAVADIKKLITDIDAETNVVAAKVDAQIAAIEALKAQLAAGTATAADLDDLVAGLTPISARLKSIGADPTAPIPSA